jgi:hypothetical protein
VENNDVNIETKDGAAEPIDDITSDKAASGIIIGVELNFEMDTQQSVTSHAKKVATLAASNSEDHDDSDGEIGAFELLASRKRKKKKTVSTTNPIISIALPSPPSEREPIALDESKHDGEFPNVRALDYLKEEEEICYDFDFEESDGDDEPESQIMEATNNKAKSDEAEIIAEKEAELATIHAYLKVKWEERSMSDMMSKEERQRAKLVENNKRELAEELARINEGLIWLKREQKKELDANIQKHQEDAQKGGGPSQESMVEWNTSMATLQAKHQEQIKQYTEKMIEKESELRAKSQKDLENQLNMLDKHHQKRRGDADCHMGHGDHAKKCVEQHEQLRVKLMKLHAEKYENKLKEIQMKRKDKPLAFLPYGDVASRDYELVAGESKPTFFDPTISQFAVARFVSTVKSYTR